MELQQGAPFNFGSLMIQFLEKKIQQISIPAEAKGSSNRNINFSCPNITAGSRI